ncbi:MAG: argininosuccinate synthase [Actinomycetota bacterium]|jgi:argininosuccinate synthase|nr:argininosuccinate synthase [Actinomycetota bacterium]
MGKRLVLAYSGGLDTSVAVHWLKAELGYEVIAVAVDVGQGDDLGPLPERALATGAIDAFVIDAREEFARDILVPSLAANARYEGRYPLVSALSRPLIVKHLVETARRFGAVAVAHGCTGKGNDQVRFDVATRALAPDLDIVAPARTWGMTREETIGYAEKHRLPITISRERIYSIDENLWGRSIECGILEDPWEAPPADVFTRTVPSATEAFEVVVGFEAGVPVSLDGERLGLVDLIGRIDAAAGSVGFGRLDMVEGRRVGIKSREVYECPGALALIAAHIDLEGMCLERDVAHEKARLEPRFAELAYDGHWYSPLRHAVSAFVSSTQRHVSGEVRLRLTPGGGLEVVGRRSPVGLYDHSLATYDAADTFRHGDAEGFVRLFGLGIETWAARQGMAGGAFGS